MKKKFILTMVLCGSLLVSYLAYSPYESKAQGEGITGVSGAPSVGQDCSSCHWVSNRISQPTLQSDIPEEGYVPNQVYNFTLLIQSQKQHAGFNIRPENSLGDAVGTIIKTDTLNSNITFSADEITHRNNIVEEGRKIVHFQWVAPAKGSGEVSFYTALGTGVMADTNGLFMDSLNLFHIAVNEAVVSMVDNQTLSDVDLSVRPTLASESITIDYRLQKASQISLVIQNEEGKKVKDLSSLHGQAGTFVQNVDVSNLPKGIYFVKLQDGVAEYMKKIIISR